MNNTNAIKLDLKIPYRINSRGQIIVKIKDLIPDPNNYKIYGHNDAEFSKVGEIADDMKERLSQGEEVPNHTPIPIDVNGNMAGGHTRRRAALKAGYTEMSITLLSEKEFNAEMSLYEKSLVSIDQNGLKRNMVPSYILNVYNSMYDNYYQRFNQSPPSETIDLWIR